MMPEASRQPLNSHQRFGTLFTNFSLVPKHLERPWKPRYPRVAELFKTRTRRRNPPCSEAAIAMLIPSPSTSFVEIILGNYTSYTSYVAHLCRVANIPSASKIFAIDDDTRVRSTTRSRLHDIPGSPRRCCLSNLQALGVQSWLL